MNWVRKLASYAIAFAALFAINFALPRIIPGDPVLGIFGQCGCISITPATRARLIERFALDKPLMDQFVAYVSALLHGDLGYSYFYNQPVVGVIMRALPWTLLLVGVSLVLSSAIGTAVGVESGWRRGRVSDGALLSAFTFLGGIPDFFIGIVLLLVFGVVLPVMPLSGGATAYSGLTGIALVTDVAYHSVLPIAALTLANTAFFYTVTRSAMVTTLSERFVATARAKGLANRAVRYHHAGRYSMLPAITQTGIRLGALFTGALLIEVVFAYPGLGTLAYQALDTRDYPLVMGIVLFGMIFLMLVNFLVDAAYARLDPRLHG